MNINTLIKGVKCSCGKLHNCNIGHVYVEKGAISRLNALCESYENILIVADRNTYSAAGKQTVSALSGKKLSEIIFSKTEFLFLMKMQSEQFAQNCAGLNS